MDTPFSATLPAADETLWEAVHEEGAYAAGFRGLEELALGKLLTERSCMALVGSAKFVKA